MPLSAPPVQLRLHALRSQHRAAGRSPVGGLRALHHLGGRPLAGRPRRRGGRPRPARRKFGELLEAVTGARGLRTQARILLFHGQSGAGKTHLIRALRTSAHRAGKAYFGYAQMTPDVDNYADYYLRRLDRLAREALRSRPGGESGLARLTNHLVGDKAVLDPAALEKLREAKLSEAAARQDGVWSSPTTSSLRPSSPARTSTSTSCARCSTCSAPTRASTSACGSISTAASSPTCRARRLPRSIPTPARGAPSRSSSCSAA